MCVCTSFYFTVCVNNKQWKKFQNQTSSFFWFYSLSYVMQSWNDILEFNEWYLIFILCEKLMIMIDLCIIINLSIWLYKWVLQPISLWLVIRSLQNYTYQKTKKKVFAKLHAFSVLIGRGNGIKPILFTLVVMFVRI